MTGHDPLCPEGHGALFGTIPICACPILRDARAEERTRLRAKVEALFAAADPTRHLYILRADVLALLDGDDT